MNQLALFDYSTLDTHTRVFVETRTAEIKVLVKRSAEDLVEIGRMVTEVKAHLGHGNFSAWREAEFRWSERTTQNLMAIYEKFKSANFADMHIATSAMYVLAAPSTPEDALQEAIERAENGERITHSLAKEIVMQYKSPSVEADAPGMAEVVYTDLGSYRRLPHNTKQCQQCLQLWAADLDYCPYCHIKPEVRAHYAALEQTKPHVSYNSGNNEWYTPQQYIDAARSVLGEIELDPASNDAANKVIQAATYYTIEDDGLVQDWFGRVWMNPPYAKGLVERFAEKLVYHHEAGDVPEAIVLVNNATETNWFRCLAAASKAICFPSSRVRFWNPDGESSEPLQGQAILYMGDDIEAFVFEFKQFGLLTKVL